jgi:hypothetical protein
VKWVVNINGVEPSGDSFTYVDPDVGSSSIELSVVRDDYIHGKESLGWGGPKKYIVAYLSPLPPKCLWDDLRSAAQKLAGNLNAVDARFL